MAKRKRNQQWWKEQRAVEKSLNDLGYRTRQQPGSGNRDITLQNDVVWHDSPIGHLELECKWRETSLWKSLLKWMGGADLLTLKCHENRKDQDGRRYVVLRWDTFLALVGSAADRSEIAADLVTVDSKDYADYCEKHRPDLLPSVEPDKPWLTECLSWEKAEDMARRNNELLEEEDRRARIQSAHQNPPQRKPKPNKLKGRGFIPKAPRK